MKLTAEIEEELKRQEEKYFNLVWYARKPPREDAVYWLTTPPEIRGKAFEAMTEIETLYPKEVEELRSPERGDWEHGFNSGALAVFRFFITALDDEMIEDEWNGGLCARGGLQNALDEFPFLDT
jgi:hypothetical protein